MNMPRLGVLLLSVVFAFGACGAAAESTLKFASYVPPQSFSAKHVLAPFARAIEKASGGDLKVQDFFGGSLGRDPFKQYSLVIDGIADIGFVQPQYSSGQFPDNSLFELPYLMRNAEEGSVAMWRMYKKGLLRGYDDIKLAGLYMTSMLAIHARKPVHSATDLRGMKIRASGNASLAYLKAVGAVPVGMATTEVTEAISRGTLDGTMTNWVGLVTFRTHNVVRHHFTGPLGTITFIIPINKKSWDGLSAKAKAAVDKFGGEYMARMAGKAYDEGDQVEMQKLKVDANRTFAAETPADEQKARAMMKPIYEEWIRATPEGRKKFDALQAILADIRAGR